MAHIVSFVCEGIFERCPDLRVAIIEGGMAWLPSLMWRLDKDWRGCHMEVPWVRRPPSSYIRDHMRLTTQPIEEPDNPAHLLQTIEHMGSDQLLMFATDYPHWDFDSPQRALPSSTPKALRKRIMADNAVEFYRLT
jgi:predicted TIM-barrel fold metal-dependent hydrolase